MKVQLKEVRDLLEGLVSAGKLPKTAAEDLLGQVSGTGASLDQLAGNLPEAQAEAILQALAGTLGLRFLGRDDPATADLPALEALSRAFCRLHGVVPLADPSGAIATQHPSDDATLEEVGFRLRRKGQIIVAAPSVIRRLLAEDIPAKGTGSETTPKPRFDPEDGETARALDQLIREAADCGASDIHLEAAGEGLRVRLRVEGVLRAHPAPVPRPAELIARLKLLGGMSVTERRLPQDGSCRRYLGGRNIELRLSTLPTVHGESMVCRLLDPDSYRKGWAELGFTEEDQAKVLSLIERPAGLLLVSGPTGSGKTTTLYTALSHLNDGARKIITVEDPVEQQIAGVEQVQVNPALGLHFGTVLRTMLRQDPDVLMIGEVRDAETAEMACRAALVGRLVLATVHASAPRVARERFINLGVPAYLVDEVLIGVLQQALVIGEGEDHRTLKAEIWVPEEG
ncbi:type II/IV secretion system protein [Loktanella sp. IMCC34160]|uniref:GspE/PulE family protein n=1 Tax=Loktanella sp. IMCC34160 TaxID=2510646 RepID=UPI00101D3960|nr:GspE/PulE family protein [Loktanella sp. IMCC34160]RYG90075.1 type II/IV secretion system protein [Loktanella sp. IMCC34160]